MVLGQTTVRPVSEQCGSGKHRQLHCKEAGLPWDEWDEACKRRFRKPTDTMELLFGEAAARDAMYYHRLAVKTNREDYPQGCQLCGEQAGAEMGEFWLPKERHADVAHYHREEDKEDTREEHSVIVHAQCGLDHKLEMA